MQPPINPGFHAVTFAYHFFSMKRESLNQAVDDLDENITYIIDSTLVNQYGSANGQKKLTGKPDVVKELVTGILEQHPKLKSLNLKVRESKSHPDRARVKFESIEIKKGVTYHYTGHLRLHFIETVEKLIKVSRMKIAITQEIIPAPASLTE